MVFLVDAFPLRPDAEDPGPEQAVLPNEASQFSSLEPHEDHGAAPASPETPSPSSPVFAVIEVRYLLVPGYFSSPLLFFLHLQSFCLADRTRQNGDLDPLCRLDDI